LLLSGCGYVHFGRLPAGAGDSAEIQREYADLSLQQKILKQELELAYKESDTLRAALEKAGVAGNTGSADATRRLEATAKELADLRASYAKLQSERTAGAPADAGRKSYTVLQEENARLTKELDATRAENASLAEKLKSSVAENQQAQSAITELSSDLQAQRRARERAEQATAALRAQLEAVMARGPLAPNPAAGDQPIDLATPPPQGSASALSLAKAPPSDAAPVAELRTSVARLRAAAAANADAEAPQSGAAAAPVTTSTPAAPSAPTQPAAAPQPPSPAPRKYSVQKGDTLEKIAIRVYGAADQWTRIYSANSDLLSTGQGLKPGMELQIP
jgi:nucleoid-associated protein YgaU